MKNRKKKDKHKSTNQLDTTVKIEKLEEQSQSISDEDFTKNVLNYGEGIVKIQNKIFMENARLPVATTSSANVFPGPSDVKQETDVKIENESGEDSEFTCDVENKNFLTDIVPKEVNFENEENDPSTEFGMCSDDKMQYGSSFSEGNSCIQDAIMDTYNQSDSLTQENHPDQQVVSDQKLQLYNCELCDYSTDRKFRLTRHVDSVHLKIKKFKCNECDYRSAALQVLKRHIKSIHLQLKNHQCNFCEYSSSSNNDLKNHIDRIHHQVKRFKCDLCKSRFFRTTDLKRHMARIHPQLKKFQCDQCPYRSSTIYILKCHINDVHIHAKKYRCDLCDYSASKKNDLQKHLERHTQIKKYKCHQCDYSSAAKNDLLNHIKRIHLLVKPHECDSCDYRAFSKADLKVHVDRIHR